MTMRRKTVNCSFLVTLYSKGLVLIISTSSQFAFLLPELLWGLAWGGVKRKRKASVVVWAAFLSIPSKNLQM